jgi:hypothetical protein
MKKFAAARRNGWRPFKKFRPPAGKYGRRITKRERKLRDQRHMQDSRRYDRINPFFGLPDGQ